MNTRNVLQTLWRGFTLRCPNCGRGAMFHGLFQPIPTCSACGVRYERREGESIGGTLINLVVAEVLSMGGLIVSQVAFSPPLAFQLTFWVSFNVLFIIFFYRHARALWVAITHLSGGLQADTEPNRS